MRRRPRDSYNMYSYLLYPIINVLNYTCTTTRIICTAMLIRTSFEVRMYDTDGYFTDSTLV